MPATLRILFLEDTPEDAELSIATLEGAGYICEWERIESREEFLERLKNSKYDLVFSDYNLPAFDGLSAAKLFVELGIDIPFILISGTLGEEAAVESLKAGATDFVLKTKLFRLPSVVERALRESEQHRLKELVEGQSRLQARALESAANAIVITDPAGMITWVNPAFTKLTGYSFDEVVGKNPRILRSGEHDASFYNELWTTILAGNVWHGEMVNLRKDGGRYYEEQTITPVMNESGEIANFISIKQDVSARTRAEKEVKLLFPIVGVGLTALTIFILAEIIEGYLQPIIGEHIASVFPITVSSLTAVGVTYYALKRQKTLYRRTLEEIAERERAEESRRESEESYRDLVENAIDVIYTHDLAGNYLSVNSVAEKITGYTREEALKMNLADTIAPEWIEKAKEMIAAKLAGETVTAYELEIIAKDGHRVTVEVNTRIIHKDGVPVRVQGIARDVTDRKQLEEQFRQSQKMEAVGVLAGGIAHDFNNLLTAISGYSELTLRKMPADDPSRGNINEIKEASERAARLTAQLLAFSRKQVLKPRVHNLNSVITEIEKMLRRVIRESVELRTVLDPQLGNIKADPGQIEQVIMNLAVNARDAMPSGGTLTIETRNGYVEDEYVSQHISIVRGPAVRMVVSDTGEGMDDETRKRIFEPFFTTKEAGKGTGLGLSTVYGIVKQSGGHIAVYSEPGHGTQFKIYFPCVDETVQAQPWVDEKEDLSGTETILLVEDEEIVRNLVREILTGNGYKVLDAPSGPAALSICESHPDPIDLLLTDVIMPKMSGNELRDRVIKLRPDIKVIFMSGYTDDAMVDRGVLDENSFFIEKPFTPDSLSRKIREVLGS